MSLYNNNHYIPHQQQEALPPAPPGPPPDISFFESNQNTQQQQHFNNHINHEYQQPNYQPSALPVGGNRPKTEADMLEEFFGSIPAAVPSSLPSQKIYHQTHPQNSNFPQQVNDQPPQNNGGYHHSSPTQQQQYPQQQQHQLPQQNSTFPQQVNDQPPQNNGGYHHSSPSQQQQYPQQQQHQLPQQNSTFPQQVNDQPLQNNGGYHQPSTLSSTISQTQPKAALGESVNSISPQLQQQRQEYSQPQQYTTMTYQPPQQTPIVAAVSGASVVPPQQHVSNVQQMEVRNPSYNPSSVGYQPQQQQQSYQPPQQQFQQYPTSYAAKNNINSNITGSETYSPTVNYSDTSTRQPQAVANPPQTTTPSYVAPVVSTQQSQIEADKARLQEIIRLRKELEREQERERKGREEKNSDTWGCTQCTYRNQKADDVCAMCQLERPSKGKKTPTKKSKNTSNNGNKSSTDTGSNINNTGTWMCSTCSYFNPESLRNCKVCQTKRRSEDSVNQGRLKQRATQANHQGGPEQDEYSCPTCTLFNKKTLGVCDACGCPNPFYVISNKKTNDHKNSESKSSSSPQKWSCPVCTFDNVSASFQCEVCSAPNPNPRNAPSGPARGPQSTTKVNPQGTQGYPAQPQNRIAASPTEPTQPESTNIKWQDDNVVLNCNKCNAAFGMMLRRHHCRACGFVFCYYCSNNRVELVPNGAKERVCIDCYRERI
eukprot:Tbor_TRINITY_DN5260_c0_g1::TRINITY_DN5260_c0_g1_i2::g.16774::m.16774